VRDARDQVAPRVFEGLPHPPRLGQAGLHALQVGGEDGQLVPALDRHRRVEVAGGHPAGRLHQDGHGPPHHPGQGERQRQRDEQREEQQGHQQRHVLGAHEHEASREHGIAESEEHADAGAEGHLAADRTQADARTGGQRPCAHDQG
jgi:hypothetical protein